MSKYQDLANFKVPEGFYGKNLVYVQLWRMVNSLFFKLSPDFMFGFRNFILRLFGAQIGKQVRIRASADIHYPWKLKIGDYSWIGYHSTIYNLGEVLIGSHVAIAHNVYICNGSHDPYKPTFDLIMGKIEIKDEVWIANDVFIGPNVKIEKGTVVGARSTVLKNLEEGMIYAGAPAKAINKRKS